MTMGAPHSEGSPPTAPRDALTEERDTLLEQLSRLLDGPMTVLAFAWLVLVILELTVGLSPFLSTVNDVIWGLFVVQFALELSIAPRKVDYLRRHWLTAVSLLLPALRVVRLARVALTLRAARGARLLRVVSTVNRGMRTLGQLMGRRGLGYVVALTAIVCALGAAGIYAFERDVAAGAIPSYGVALWWTAMTLTTMGADYFPRTAEGRLLGLLLAIYGFAVFGYVTASIASLFIARDESHAGAEASGPQVDALRAEVAALTLRIYALLSRDSRPT